MAPSLAPILSLKKSDMCAELVGMAGFEPAASCSQSRRANQAAPHPAEPYVAYRPAGHGPVPRDRGRAARLLPTVVVRRRTPRPGTLSVLTWRADPAAGRAGVAQWQSPSLPSWS